MSLRGPGRICAFTSLFGVESGQGFSPRSRRCVPVAFEQSAERRSPKELALGPASGIRAAGQPLKPQLKEQGGGTAPLLWPSCPLERLRQGGREEGPGQTPVQGRCSSLSAWLLRRELSSSPREAQGAHSRQAQPQRLGSPTGPNKAKAGSASSLSPPRLWAGASPHVQFQRRKAGRVCFCLPLLSPHRAGGWTRRRGWPPPTPGF